MRAQMNPNPNAYHGFQREFLIRLAPVWLACRWKIFGHQLWNWPFGSDLEYDLLGLNDYGQEMCLLCRESRRTTLDKRQ